MLHKIFRVLGVITLSAFLMGGLVGCQQTAKKPTPRQESMEKRSPSPTAPVRKPVTTITNTEAKRIADRLAKEAVKVRGVDKAAVVVDTTGTRPNAYVGLELKTGVRGEETKQVKMNVEKRLKSAEPRLHSVNVTSDPDLVKRIQDIAAGIGKGKPITTFASELKELGRRITPTTR